MLTFKADIKFLFSKPSLWMMKMADDYQLLAAPLLFLYIVFNVLLIQHLFIVFATFNKGLMFNIFWQNYWHWKSQACPGIRITALSLSFCTLEAVYCHRWNEVTGKCPIVCKNRQMRGGKLSVLICWGNAARLGVGKTKENRYHYGTMPRNIRKWHCKVSEPLRGSYEVIK